MPLLPGLKNVQLPQAVIDSRRQSIGVNPKIIYYPSDLASHFILFQFKRYARYKANTKDSSQILDSVALPIPHNLVEHHSVDYSVDNLGILGNVIDDPNITGAARDAWDAFKDRKVAGASAQDFSDIGTKLGNSLNNLWSSKTDIALGIMRQALKRTPVGEASEQFIGLIENPHTITNFTGVNLRKHFFSWEFAPQTPQDSVKLRSIYLIIRKHMLPPQTANRVLLQFPSEVDISIGGLDDIFNINFKTAVVLDVKYDPQPEGAAYFTNTGAPVFSTMSMTLLETEIFTRDDSTYFSLGNYGGSPVQNIDSIPGV